MPRITSRVRADVLQESQDALATAQRELEALRQHAEEQQDRIDAVQGRNASLATELSEAHACWGEARRELDEMKSTTAAREEQHRVQVRRLEGDVHTLEEMLQAARRRERAAVREDAGQHRECHEHAELRAELRRMQAQLSQCEAQLQGRQEALATAGVSASGKPRHTASSSLATSTHALYAQDQLLQVCQRSVSSLDTVRQHLRPCLPLPPRDAQDSTADVAAAAAQWERRLFDLQARFDQAVQADAKVISFLLLTAQQQSGQLRTLQQRWSEAQETMQEAEAVLSEAHTRMTRSAEEATVLRQECAALAALQTALQAQLADRTRAHESASAMLQRLQATHTQLTEAHAMQKATWSARLARAAEAQREACADAARLQAALAEKERQAAAAARQSRHEVAEAVKAQMRGFFAQLSSSAQQLHGSLAEWSDAPPEKRLRAASSAGSPDPSPPGASSYAASSSPLSATYDDSIFLPEASSRALEGAHERLRAASPC